MGPERQDAPSREREPARTWLPVVTEGPADISVLVPSRNRPESLRRTIRSVMAQDYARIRILVGDDASTPAISASDLTRLGTIPVRVIRSENPVGVIANRARLVEASTSQILFFADDDVTLPGPDCLSRVAGLFSELGSVGLVALRVTDHREGRTRVLGPCRSASPEGDVIKDTGHFFGAAFAVRRDAIISHVMDLAVTGYGHEEIEIAYLVASANLRMICNPGFVADHHRTEVAPSRDETRTRFRSAVRNRLVVARTYLPYPYRAAHVGFWIVRYFGMALRGRILSSYFKGLREGLTERPRQRRKLSKRALSYLVQCGGRVWY